MSAQAPTGRIRRYDWAPIDNARLRRGEKLSVRKGSFFEIKPHRADAMADGVAQLKRILTGKSGWRPIVPSAQAWLVTYLPYTASNVVASFGRAASINVYAQQVVCCSGRDTCTTIPCAGTCTARRVGPLYDLGRIEVPQKIDFPSVDQPGFFGQAIESSVRAKIFRKVDRPAARGGGGARPGPDAWVEELAALFGELSRLYPDGLYEELAHELTLIQ